MDISVNGVLAGAAKIVSRALRGRPVPSTHSGAWASPEAEATAWAAWRGPGRDPASYRGARRNAMRAIGKIADWRLGPWNALPRGEREFTVVHLGLPQKITRKRFQIIHGSLASRGQAFA